MTDPNDPNDPDDRRKDVRHVSAASVRWGDSDAESLHSQQLRDVSSRGMFVVCDESPPMMTECRFELLREDGSVLARGLGRIVWVQPGVGVGLEFIDTQLGETEISTLTSAEGPAVDTAKVQARKGTTEVSVITIGIDLGTSNTCASIVRDGKPQVLPNRFGTNTIPSVVTIDDAGAILVGHAAAKRMLLSPERTVYGSKRLMGRTYREELVEEYQPFFAYPIVEAEENSFGANLEGRVISMEEVARHILGEVRQVAERHLRARVEQAVITVPAYFNEVQRESVREAGHRAGLEKVRIISEPTAAALAYGYNREEKSRLAVFDLGGGTFDISVLDIEDNDFAVVATGGDCFLGGIDFDDFIASYLLEQFNKAERMSLEPDPQQLARLREAASEAKHGLSVQSRFTVSLPQFAHVKGKWFNLNASVDRELLDEVGGPLLDRMMAITSMVLETAEIPPTSIKEVLLVGGMTRAPMVQDRVEAFFGRKPSRRINPDEAVAVGAALMAHETDQEGGGVRLQDVLPLSIGIAGEGRRFLRLLSRQTRVPTERTFLIQTKEDDQTVYELPIFQGERPDAAANEYLGTVLIENIPPGAAGTNKYELAVRLDQESVMTVGARDERSGTRVPVRLERNLDVRDVVDRLGPYEGPPMPPEEPVRPPASGIGKLFGKFLGIFRRRR